MEELENKKKDNRGRHNEEELHFAPTHETKIFEDPDGVKRIWIYNRDISKLGPISCETIYPEGYQALGEKALTKADMKKQERDEKRALKLSKKLSKEKVKSEKKLSKEVKLLNKIKLSKDKKALKELKKTKVLNPKTGKYESYNMALKHGLIK